MFKKVDREAKRQKRRYRIRKKVSGTAETPRMSVYRSLSHMYVQLIDDVNGVTLVSASTADKEMKADIANGAKVEAAKTVGKKIAERAIAKGIETVVFDRSGYLYTGRVQALADAAREAGLKF